MARRRRRSLDLGRRSADALADGAGRVAELTGAAMALVENVVSHVQWLVDDVTDDSSEVVYEAEKLYDSVRGRVEEARGAVRAAPRLTRVVSELLTIVARYRIQEAIQGARREVTGDEREETSLQRLHERCAVRARMLCEEHRGGILKLGQFLSTRMDVLPEPYVRELSQLQDRVPALPADEIALRLSDELGDDWGEHFACFEPEPLAAASLAQVHGATLADGTSVAVKVLIPEVEDLVETDLAAVRVLLPPMSDLVPRVDVETIVGELARGLRRELDLQAEGNAARELAHAFADDPDVIVPRVYGHASTHGVLVLERIEGTRMLEFLEACENRGEEGARDRDRIFEILIRCYAAQVLQHGLFQADAHAGNFLVVSGPDGPRLALLDFGCMERYERPLRRAYAELALAILASDQKRMAELFAEMGFQSRTGDPDSLRAYSEMMLQVFREDVSFEQSAADPRAQVGRVLELTTDNPVVEIPPHFVMLGRVFSSLGGLLLRFRPRVNLARLLTVQLAGALRAEEPKKLDA